jgi:hypothetical protein
MTLEDLSVLRHYADEQSDSIYGDVFLQEVIDRNTGDLYAAAAEVWGMKAARFAKLVNVSESGSSRSLSQKADNARSMAAFYLAQSPTAVIDQSGQTATRPIIRPTGPRPTA